VSADINNTEVKDKNRVTGIWYAVALIIPIIGFILGIVALARNEVGPGLALWATSFAGCVCAIALQVYS